MVRIRPRRTGGLGGLGRVVEGEMRNVGFLDKNIGLATMIGQ
jgi:hypothetical protein